MGVTGLLLTLALTSGCNQQLQNLGNSGKNMMAGNIVGGTLVKNENLLGSVVFLQLQSGNCSGSYIGNGKIVTAGHCII